MEAQTDPLNGAGVKAIADRCGLAILVVHHTRKATADDFVDAVSGTQGLAGASDAVLVLSRPRGSADAKMHLTGRDVEEAEYAMQFDPAQGTWALLEGPPEEYELGGTRRRILAYLRENGPRSPKQLADELALDHDLVRQTASRMARDDQIGCDGNGLYYHLSHQSQLSQHSPVTRRAVTAVTPVPAESEGAEELPRCGPPPQTCPNPANTTRLRSNA